MVEVGDVFLFGVVAWGVVGRSNPECGDGISIFDKEASGFEFHSLERLPVPWF